MNFIVSAEARSTCPFIARIQPRCERITVIGSRSIIASSGISRVVNGVGADPDIVVASAKAYLSALTKLHSKVDRVAAQG